MMNRFTKIRLVAFYVMKCRSLAISVLPALLTSLTLLALDGQQASADEPEKVLTIDTYLSTTGGPLPEVEAGASAMQKYTVYDWLTGPGARHMDRQKGSPFVPAVHPPVRFESEVAQAIWLGDFETIKELPDTTSDADANSQVLLGLIKALKPKTKFPPRFVLAGHQYISTAHRVYSDKQWTGMELSYATDAQIKKGESVLICYLNDSMSSITDEVKAQKGSTRFSLLDDSVGLKEEDINEAVQSANIKTLLDLQGGLIGEDAAQNTKDATDTIFKIRRDMARFVIATHSFSNANWQLTENFRRFMSDEPSIQAVYISWRNENDAKHALLPAEVYPKMKANKPIPGELLGQQYAGRTFDRAAVAKAIHISVMENAKKQGFAPNTFSKKLLSEQQMNRFDLKLLFESLGEKDELRREAWNQTFGGLGSIDDTLCVVQPDTNSEFIAAQRALHNKMGFDEISLQKAIINGPAIAFLLLNEQARLKANPSLAENPDQTIARKPVIAFDTDEPIIETGSPEHGLHWSIPESWHAGRPENTKSLAQYRFGEKGKEMHLFAYVLNRPKWNYRNRADLMAWVNRIRKSHDLKPLSNPSQTDMTTLPGPCWVFSAPGKGELHGTVHATRPNYMFWTLQGPEHVIKEYRPLFEALVASVRVEEPIAPQTEPNVDPQPVEPATINSDKPAEQPTRTNEDRIRSRRERANQPTE